MPIASRIAGAAKARTWVIRRSFALCLRAMARNRNERFPDMKAFADALDAWLNHLPLPAPAAGSVSADAGADLRLVADILTLLRRWGWEKGIDLVRRAHPTGPQTDVETSLEAALIGWLAGVLALRPLVRTRL